MIVLEMVWKHLKYLDYTDLYIIVHRLLEAKDTTCRLLGCGPIVPGVLFQKTQEASFILLNFYVQLPVFYQGERCFRSMTVIFAWFSQS